ncbi:Heterochromatin protein 1 [Dictyocoela muelleri]|nr:Heterochromatin protein 1 [Dictyocoela muelleri]
MSDEEIYIVEKIVSDRNTKRGKQYLIKWEGFPDSENSWVSAKDIFDKELIDTYEKTKIQNTTNKSKNSKKESVGKKQKQVIVDKRPYITNEWDSTIESILSVQQGEKGLEALIQFKDGKILVVPIDTAHEKCPLRLIEFYEKNMNFVEIDE